MFSIFCGIVCRSLEFSLRYPSHFEIKVTSFHMFSYYHEVLCFFFGYFLKILIILTKYLHPNVLWFSLQDIFVDFDEVFAFWKNKYHITVFKGAHSWPLEILKRRNGWWTAIHTGQIQFCDDLHLNVGDKYCFKWIHESYERFHVEVVKAIIEID